jgi:hypothetical protein
VLVADSTNPPGAAPAAAAGLPPRRRLTSEMTETSVNGSLAARVTSVGEPASVRCRNRLRKAFAPEGSLVNVSHVIRASLVDLGLSWRGEERVAMAGGWHEIDTFLKRSITFLKRSITMAERVRYSGIAATPPRVIARFISGPGRAI